MKSSTIVLAVLLAACGGDATTSTTDAVTPTTSPVADTTTPDDQVAPTTTIGESPATTLSSAEGVPDACGLIEAGELSALLGFDVGEPEPRSLSPDRSTCFYSSGIVTAIEIAENYELSRQLIEEDGRETAEIAGLGNGAFHDPYGQVVVLGDEYFVAISSAESVEVMTQVAAALHEAAEG